MHLKRYFVLCLHRKCVSLIISSLIRRQLTKQLKMDKVIPQTHNAVILHHVFTAVYGIWFAHDHIQKSRIKRERACWADCFSLSLPLCTNGHENTLTLEPYSMNIVSPLHQHQVTAAPKCFSRELCCWPAAEITWGSLSSVAGCSWESPLLRVPAIAHGLSFYSLLKEKAVADDRHFARRLLSWPFAFLSMRGVGWKWSRHYAFN